MLKMKVAFSMLAIININFYKLDKDTFKLLYKILVRSHQYGHSVWNLFKIGVISDLERVQKPRRVRQEWLKVVRI